MKGYGVHVQAVRSIVSVKITFMRAIGAADKRYPQEIGLVLVSLAFVGCIVSRRDQTVKPMNVPEIVVLWGSLKVYNISGGIKRFQCAR